MKKILLLLLLFAGYFASGQVVIQRTPYSTIPIDQNLFTIKNFKVPVYPDTTTANLWMPKDSLGLVIQLRTGEVYHRDTTDGGHKWSLFGGNTGAVNSVFTRDGDVVALEGDYSSFYPLLSGSYDNPDWLNSLPAAKISGAGNLTAGSTKISLGGTPGGATLQNLSIDANEGNFRLQNIGGSLNVNQINATGTADATTVLFGNGTWGSPGGGGAGATNSNVGTGYRWAIPTTNNIKTLFGRGYIVIDSSSNTNGLTFFPDTGAFKLATKTDLTAYFKLSDSTTKGFRSMGFYDLRYAAYGDGLAGLTIVDPIYLSGDSLGIHPATFHLTKVGSGIDLLIPHAAGEAASRFPLFTSATNNVVRNVDSSVSIISRLNGLQSIVLDNDTSLHLLHDTTASLQDYYYGFSHTNRLQYNKFSDGPPVDTIGNKNGLMTPAAFKRIYTPLFFKNDRDNPSADSTGSFDQPSNTVYFRGIYVHSSDASVTVDESASDIHTLDIDLSASGGSGNTNSNVGSGFRLAKPTTNDIKTLTCSGCTLDSATTNQIRITFDSTSLSDRINKKPKVFNVLDYGAKGDGKRVFDGAISSSSSTFTSATAGFTSGDVGKCMLIPGGGVSGVDLPVTITAFTNSTTVTVSVSASTTVSADTVNFGTDNTAAFQAAIQADSANGGGKIWVPNGIYLFNGPLIQNWGGNPNSILHWPVAAAGKPSWLTRSTYLIEGETPMNPDSYGDRNGDSLAPRTGVVLLPITYGSGNAPALFGSKSAGGRTAINVGYKNLNILLPRNLNGGGPTVGGINDYYINNTGIEGVLVGIDGAIYKTADPTNEVAAIIVNATGTGEDFYINRSLVQGFKYGWVFADHAAGNVSAFGCKNAFVFPLGAYAGAFWHMTAQWCVNYIYSPATTILGYVSAGGGFIKTGLLNIEVSAISGSPWDNYGYLINDSSNNLTGEMGYFFLADANPIFKYGGNNVLATKLGHYGNYLSSSAINIPYGENGYTGIDMTFNHAMGGGVRIKSLAVGVNQGQIAFDNAAIAIAGTPGTTAGREISFYDSITNKYQLLISTNTGRIVAGPSLSNYGLLIDVPTSGKSMTINSNGIVELGGLNSTANTYGTGYTALERSYSNLTFGDLGNAYLNSNLYFNGSVYKYMNASSSPGSQITTYNGDVFISTAPSGTGTATLTQQWAFKNNGHLLGGTLTDSSAILHIGAGSTTIAPLKLTAGALNTTPRNGAIEFTGTHFYGTAGGTRYQLDQQSGGLSGLTTNQLMYATSSTAIGGSTNFTVDATNKALQAIHFVGLGSTPTQASLGTNVTSITITGTDVGYNISVVTSAAVTGTICSINLANTYATAPNPVVSLGQYTTAITNLAIGASVSTNTIAGDISGAGTYIIRVHNL